MQKVLKARIISSDMHRWYSGMEGRQFLVVDDIYDTSSIDYVKILYDDVYKNYQIRTVDVELSDIEGA